MQPTAQEFVNLFNLPRDGFHEAIQLEDSVIGFSLYKDRQEDGFKSLYRIYIDEEQSNNESTQKSLTLTASYGKETQGGITISSSDFKRRLNWPIEMRSEGEFFFDTETKEIFHKNKVIDPFEVLIKLDRAHTLPQLKWDLDAIVLKSKLLIQKGKAFFFGLLFKFIATIYFIFTDLQIKVFHDIDSKLLQRKQTVSVKEEEKDLEDIEFYGIKIPQSLAVLYSFSHLLVFIFFYYRKDSPDIIETIFSNGFLTLLYVIVTVAISKKIFPINISELKFNPVSVCLKWLQEKRFAALTAKILVPLK